MKTGLIIAFVCLFSSARSDAETGRGRMELLLAAPSIQNLVQLVSTNVIESPAIHSFWFTESRVVPAARSEAEIARQLGRHYLELVDQAALSMPALTNLVECQAATECLLAAAKWIGTPVGYENTLLAARTHDVATIPMGRLLVSPSFPAAQSLELVRQLGARWYEVEFRALVLNKEAEFELFPQDAAVATTQVEIEKIWTVGLMRRRLSKHELLEKCAALGLSSQQRRIEHFVDKNFFFTDSPKTSSHTTLERWNLKNHAAFVYGYEPSNLQLVLSLARFRALVGHIPGPVAHTQHPFASQLEAAFEMAWRPFQAKEGPIYGYAHDAYVKIMNDAFLDQDASLLKMRADADRAANKVKYPRLRAADK